MTIHIQPDGTFQLPAFMLEQLGTNQVEVRLEGKTVYLEAARYKRIHELETLDECRAAFAAFLQQIQHSGNPNLLDWCTLKDQIYP